MKSWIFRGFFVLIAFQFLIACGSPNSSSDRAQDGLAEGIPSRCYSGESLAVGESDRFQGFWIPIDDEKTDGAKAEADFARLPNVVIHAITKDDTVFMIVGGAISDSKCQIKISHSNSIRYESASEAIAVPNKIDLSEAKARGLSEEDARKSLARPARYSLVEKNKMTHVNSDGSSSLIRIPANRVIAKLKDIQKSFERIEVAHKAFLKRWSGKRLVLEKRERSFQRAGERPIVTTTIAAHIPESVEAKTADGKGYQRLNPKTLQFASAGEVIVNGQNRLKYRPIEDDRRAFGLVIEQDFEGSISWILSGTIKNATASGLTISTTIVYDEGGKKRTSSTAMLYSVNSVNEPGGDETEVGPSEPDSRGDENPVTEPSGTEELDPYEAPPEVNENENGDDLLR